MIDEAAIRSRYDAVRDCLNKFGRRLFAAAEARAAGYGGVSAVSRATKIARSTIDRGVKDLAKSAPSSNRVRRAGGGRRALTMTDATLLDDLRRLIEPATMGDPMRPLLWVSKSHAKLAAALRKMGHTISASRSLPPSSTQSGIIRSRPGASNRRLEAVIFRRLLSSTLYIFRRRSKGYR